MPTHRVQGSRNRGYSMGVDNFNNEEKIWEGKSKDGKSKRLSCEIPTIKFHALITILIGHWDQRS